MKITSMKLNNFRGYNREIDIKFNDLTAIVGKNDIGKSTILEALDIFFNDPKGSIKLDKNDVNKLNLEVGNAETIIGVCFGDLPETVVIDSSVETSLGSEFLLNDRGELEVIKKYQNGGSAKIYIKAKHPSNPECSDLLLKKNQELKKVITDKGIKCDNLTVNSIMRNVIWNHYKEDLQLEEREIDVSKEDARKIWEKLTVSLPVYSLFQADRKNSDNDSEVQDPLKQAVKQILNEESIQKTLSEIAATVQERIQEVSDRTLEKIKEMDVDIANSLTPIIPQTESLKWSDVFKNVSISGDENIPINKRGSGVRRLILLNFFRAEAERLAENNSNSNVIYAIEEPETSQHTHNQIKLINSLIDLSQSEGAQIILTTHSPNIVKRLEFSDLILIREVDGEKSLEPIDSSSLNYPSLNEVNYLAFEEVTEEYHNELYGYIESQGWFDEYKNGKETVSYNKLLRNGGTRVETIILTQYIRHQIHHPENEMNSRFTLEDLKNSIEMMREFVRERGNEAD